MILPPQTIHPEGESEYSGNCTKHNQIELDTYGGKVFVEWDPDAAVTPLAQLPFFIEFLKLGKRFDPWVESCPLFYTSNNAPEKIDVLGSLFLSILSGHNRFSHITTLMSDGVNSKLLGMNKVVSDDSARRGLKKIEERPGVTWLQNHLHSSYEPLLTVPWILDCDVTVKPLYGKQEGSVVGYNPHKKGRPSHTYHTYMVANLRLVLDVEVMAGNESSAKHSMPGLLALLSRLDNSLWPHFIRGDCDWGSDGVMKELEEVGAKYLFKVKKHSKVKELIYQVHGEGEWQHFKSGWEAKEGQLDFTRSNESRRVVIVRRSIQKDVQLVVEDSSKPKQQTLAFIDEPDNLKLYEYSVLITNLDSDIISIIQHYRDRADSENIFDELKNQWGWGGYTTKELKTSKFMSRIVALIYNWWNLFVRLASPEGYQEAITSKPLLLSGVGRLTQSGRQKKMIITSQHGWGDKARQYLSRLNGYFSKWKAIAPQLTAKACWQKLLQAIIDSFQSPQAVGPPKPLLSG